MMDHVYEICVKKLKVELTNILKLQAQIREFTC